jgi:hypothetical protein
MSMRMQSRRQRIGYMVSESATGGRMSRRTQGRKQTANSRQQTADSRQQTADSRQQTADRADGGRMSRRTQGKGESNTICFQRGREDREVKISEE